MSATADLIHPEARVHSSARIDPTARIGAGAIIEEDVIIGPHCVVGSGTRLRARCMIIEHTTLGEMNDVHPYAVLGGDPQDRSFDVSRRGELIIGDRNIIREGATISRGNWNGPATRIGSGCYLMSLTHIGHNASIGDSVTMANGASLAGHSRVGNNCVMSGYSGVHQFVDVGEGVMFQGGAMVSMHVPPFVVVGGGNFVAGLNSIGLRRNPAITPSDRAEVKRVFRMIYRERSAAPMKELMLIISQQPWGPAATKFIDFINQAMAMEKPRGRGICGGRKMKIRSRSVSEGLSDSTAVEV